MFPGTPLSETLSLLMLAVPAVARFGLGRRLVTRLDDPAFPELRVAAGHRVTMIAAVCFPVGMLLGSSFLALKTVAALGAILVADYPARRAMFGETWGLAPRL